jgi:hypothetical protein
MQNAKMTTMLYQSVNRLADDTGDDAARLHFAEYPEDGLAAPRRTRSRAGVAYRTTLCN